MAWERKPRGSTSAAALLSTGIPIRLGTGKVRDPIYQTVPFYLGLDKGKSYGIFFDNSYRSYFDFGKSSQQRAWFGAEGGELNYYFFYGPAIKKILSRYSELTGHMPFPAVGARNQQESLELLSRYDG